MRRLGLFAALALLAVWTSLRLPLPHHDPFRGTLILLPLVVAALLAVSRWAGQRGGRRLPSRVAVAQGVALGVLVLLTVGRQHLGLSSTVGSLDRMLAGGFLLVLAHQIAWLVVALRPALGQTLPERPPWPFFALPLVVYVAILPWSTGHHPPDGDEPHYLLLTHSLAWDLDTDLTNNYEQGDSLRFMDRRLEPQFGDPVGRNGELYSRHNMLLPLVLAPAYRLMGLHGALMIMAALTAVTCWLILALAFHYSPSHSGETLAAWAILAFTAPFLLFSYQVWVEIPAATLTLLALLQMHRLKQGHKGRWQAWLALAAPLVFLPLLKIRFLLIAGPLTALVLWRSGPALRKRVVVVAGSMFLLGAGILLFNQLVFQNPLKYHDFDGLQPYVFPPQNYPRGFGGLFFDSAFGLYAHAPIWMLLLPAILAVLWTRAQLFTDFVVVFLPYLFLLCPRGEWFGGWSPPFRYGVAMLPVLALWLVPLLALRRWRGHRLLMGSLIALTLCLTLFWIVEPGWTYNLAHGRTHLLDHLSTRFSADVARFFPSSTRLRAATKLWPPLTFIVCTLLWWIPLRRCRRPTAWGVAALLMLAGLLPWAARHRATRVIEFEDPWVRTTGGRVHPDQWVIYRPQYRGGWILPGRRSVRVPLVEGGDRLWMRVDLKVLPITGPGAHLELGDRGGGVLAETEIGSPGEWQSVSFEAVRWEPGQGLTLSVRGPKAAPNRPRVLLDRAFLTWD